MNYKFIEYIDLLLRLIYEYDSKDPGQYFDLNEISKQLGESNIYRVLEASDVLSSRGLIKAQKYLGGQCIAALTGEGKLYVEEGGKSGIIQQYDAHPENYNISISGNNVSLNIGSGNTAQVFSSNGMSNVVDILDQIDSKIGSDKTLTEDNINDLKLDVNSLKSQLRKKEPNMNIVASIIQSLSNVASIADLIGKLMSLLKLN